MFRERGRHLGFVCVPLLCTICRVVVFQFLYLFLPDFILSHLLQMQFLDMPVPVTQFIDLEVCSNTHCYYSIRPFCRVKHFFKNCHP